MSGPRSISTFSILSSKTRHPHQSLTNIIRIDTTFMNSSPRVDTKILADFFGRAERESRRGLSYQPSAISNHVCIYVPIHKYTPIQRIQLALKTEILPELTYPGLPCPNSCTSSESILPRLSRTFRRTMFPVMNPKAKIQNPKTQKSISPSASRLSTHLIALRIAPHLSSSHSIRDIIPHNVSYPYNPLSR